MKKNIRSEWRIKMNCNYWVIDPLLGHRPFSLLVILFVFPHLQYHISPFTVQIFIVKVLLRSSHWTRHPKGFIISILSASDKIIINNIEKNCIFHVLASVHINWLFYFLGINHLKSKKLACHPGGFHLNMRYLFVQCSILSVAKQPNQQPGLIIACCLSFY